MQDKPRSGARDGKSFKARPKRGARRRLQVNGSNIAIIGAGAIGGATAVFMRKAGWDPILVCKHAETLAQAISPGITVTGVKGTHTTPVRSVLAVRDLPADLDIVFHATKANDCLSAARDLLPRLHTDSVVVSLQNGISEEALAGILGRKRVIGCVVGWGATNNGSGSIEVTSEGEFILGALDRRPAPRLELIRSMLAAVQPTRISDNIMGELYAKLMINACINTLGAITGEALGDLLAVRKIRNVFIALMQEALDVAFGWRPGSAGSWTTTIFWPAMDLSGGSNVISSSASSASNTVGSDHPASSPWSAAARPRSITSMATSATAPPNTPSPCRSIVQWWPW